MHCLQDTAEVQEAKARFGDAFADAEAGIVSVEDENVSEGMTMSFDPGRPSVH